MTDSELRTILLRFLYDTRKAHWPLRLWHRPFSSGQPRTDLPANIDEDECRRIFEQLADHGLINWEGYNVNGKGFGGHGEVKINAFGVDVIEGNKKPPIALFHIDQSVHNTHTHQEDRRVTVSRSQGVQIAGDDSEQQQTIRNAFEEIAAKIEESKVPEPEKAEAKSLLLKVLESKAVSSLLGAGAGYIAHKLGG